MFFYFEKPSVCDGHEWEVWSVGFFLLVGCPFLWLECIFTLLTVLSAPVIWSDHVSVVWCAQQVGLFSFFVPLTTTPETVWGYLLTNLFTEGRVGSIKSDEKSAYLLCLVFGSGSRLCVFPVYDSVSFVLLTNICITILIFHRLIFQHLCFLIVCLWCVFVCRPANPLPPSGAKIVPTHSMKWLIWRWITTFPPSPAPLPMLCDNHQRNTLILNISLSLLSLCPAEVEKGQKDQKDPGELMFSFWFS